MHTSVGRQSCEHFRMHSFSALGSASHRPVSHWASMPQGTPSGLSPSLVGGALHLQPVTARKHAASAANG